MLGKNTQLSQHQSMHYYSSLRIFLVFVLYSGFALSSLKGQSLRPLSPEDGDSWREIKQRIISPDGRWVVYEQAPLKGNSEVFVHDVSRRDEFSRRFARATGPQMDYNGQYTFFLVQADYDSLKAMRRAKRKASKFPHDTLGIYIMAKDSLLKIPHVKSYKIPKKASNYLAYQLYAQTPIPVPPKPEPSAEDTLREKQTPEVPEEEEEKEDKKRKSRKNKDPEPEPEPEPIAPDTLQNLVSPETQMARDSIMQLQIELENLQKLLDTLVSKSQPKPKIKKENTKNGLRLILHSLQTAQQDTFPFVTAYVIDEKGTRLAFASTGDEKEFKPGVYIYDLQNQKLLSIFQQEGLFKGLQWDKAGTQLGFLADTDTSKAHKKDPVKTYALYYWQEKNQIASKLVDSSNPSIPNDWLISENARLKFSEDGTKLYFGTAPRPLQADTNLLPEEIIQVDVWNWKDSRLQSQQLSELSRDKKKTYQAVVYPRYRKVLQLARPEIPNIMLAKKGNSDFAIGTSNEPYLKEVSWMGYPRYQDVYIISYRDGSARKLKEKIQGSAQLSPNAQYIYWYEYKDSTWYSYALRTGQTIALTQNSPVKFYRELHDEPRAAPSYGYAGWLAEDQAFLVYDRYDIWQLDPLKRVPPIRLTSNGREKRITYRYLKLDPEETFLKPEQPWVLSAFDLASKSSGFFKLDPIKRTPPLKMVFDEYSFRGLRKARNKEEYLFTRESYRDFPDLYVSDPSFTQLLKVSQANPQQNSYFWGSAELVNWTAPSGEELQGLLYKPDNFDPGKKYPMVTYFYERNSQNLHRYESPLSNRSVIRKPLYTSNGYLVFVPDIPYILGHPGQSAYDAVISGVTHMLAQGYVDRDRLGVQGHSWGGYQIAYLITQTNLFAAAIAGAPVSNMTSAYGGIRWQSGLSRMFQYERSQSRLGATLWEKPLLYIENSPLFFADRIETPVLMMHNDADGAVPWYQGIEFFVALRRLNKPAWMLNYNGEAHGLTQSHNRLDYAIRMFQFFNYYLKFQAEPAWMRQGVPALEKGIYKRYELLDKE